MRLIVLSENMAGGRFFAEHGLSYLIEHDNQLHRTAGTGGFS